MITEEKENARLEICKSCEYCFKGKNPRCTICGCDILKIIKESNTKGKCPINKWSK